MPCMVAPTGSRCGPCRDCTSSEISSAQVSLQRARSAARYGWPRSTRRPRLHRLGDHRGGVVRRRAQSLRGHPAARNSTSNAPANPYHLLAAPPGHAPAAAVRPWKLPSIAPPCAARDPQRELERVIVGLGAGVAEEHRVEALAGEVGETRRSARAAPSERHGIALEQQRARLVLSARGHRGLRVSRAPHGVAAVEVEDAAAVARAQRAALGVHHVRSATGIDGARWSSVMSSPPQVASAPPSRRSRASGSSTDGAARCSLW